MLKMSRAGAAIDADGAAEGGLVDGARAQVISRRNLSCTACFDALGFCYSTENLKIVLTSGVLSLIAFVSKPSLQWKCRNTRGYAYGPNLFSSAASYGKSQWIEAILESREKNQPHIWKFRTVEEASREWNKVYGHLNDD